MGKIRLAAIQPRVTDDVSKNLENVLRYIRSAATASPDIVSLPEAWLNGFCSPNDLRRLARSAEEFGCYIICGGLWERFSGGYFVTCPVIAPDGHIIGRQTKLHLFGDEHGKFLAGRQIRVFQTPKARIGCVICHDLVFPEVTRLMALKGAEIIFNPSKIAHEGIRPWQRYLAVRSLENRIPILGSNVVMRAKDHRYPGKSVMVSPIHVTDDILDVQLKSLGSGPAVLTCDVDLRPLLPSRKERLREMRRDLYSVR